MWEWIVNEFDHREFGRIVLCVALAGMILTMFVLSFRDTVRGFREVFLPKSFRFRLRSLFVVFTLIQVLVAVTMWLASDGVGVAAALDAVISCLLLTGPMLCLAWLLATEAVPRGDVFRHKSPPPGFLDRLAKGRGKRTPVPPPVADSSAKSNGRRKRRWWKRRCGPAVVGLRLWTTPDP